VNGVFAYSSDNGYVAPIGTNQLFKIDLQAEYYISNIVITGAISFTYDDEFTIQLYNSSREMTFQQNYGNNADTGFIETDQFVLAFKPVFFLDNFAVGGDPALEAHVNTIDTRVEENSAVIATLLFNSGINNSFEWTSRYVRILNTGPTLNIVEFAVYVKDNGREDSMEGATQYEPSPNNRVNNIAQGKPYSSNGNTMCLSRLVNGSFVGRSDNGWIAPIGTNIWFKIDLQAEYYISNILITGGYSFTYDDEFTIQLYNNSREMTLEQNYSNNANTGFIETDQFVLDFKPVFFLDNDAIDSGSGGYDPALEAYVGAIDARVEDNSAAIESNTNRIQTLENGGGSGGGGGSTDLGLLEARVDALETAGSDNRTVVKSNISRIQTLETRMTDLGQLETNFSVLDNIVDNNSNSITSLSGRIQTLENGGGGGGGGGESVDLGPLEESVRALDSRVGGNTTSIREITGTGGQIQSLYSIADANSHSISQLDTDVMRVANRTLILEDTVGNNSSTIQQVEVNVGQNTSRSQQNLSSCTNLESKFQNLNTLSNTLATRVQSIDTQYQNLNTLYTNTASNVQSVIKQQTLIRNQVLALEQAPKNIYYMSQEIRLNQYQNGKMLVILYQMNYAPLRIIMKARDINTGYIYTVNPGHDYGFNYRIKPPPSDPK